MKLNGNKFTGTLFEVVIGGRTYKKLINYIIKT